jgi:hypothetical protein
MVIEAYKLLLGCGGRMVGQKYQPTTTHTAQTHENISCADQMKSLVVCIITSLSAHLSAVFLIFYSIQSDEKIDKTVVTPATTRHH